jgi:hypothetical protein
MLTISGLGLAPAAMQPSGAAPAPTRPGANLAVNVNWAATSLFPQTTQPPPAPSDQPTMPGPTFPCADGSVATSPSLCPTSAGVAPQPLDSGTAIIPAVAPSSAPTSYVCADGVTVVTAASLCPTAMAANNAGAFAAGAAPAPGSSTGMQITPAVPPPGTTPPLYTCPDGVTMTADPTMASCPVVVAPTILGISQSTFIWGAAIAAAGIGAFLLLQKKSA